MVDLVLPWDCSQVRKLGPILSSLGFDPLVVLLRSKERGGEEDPTAFIPSPFIKGLVTVPLLLSLLLSSSQSAAATTTAGIV